MSLEAYSILKNGNQKLSEHFKVREFYCRDGSDPVFIDTELVDILEKVRVHFGKPVTIRVHSARRATTRPLAVPLTVSTATARRRTFRYRASAWRTCMPTRTSCWAMLAAAASTRPVSAEQTAGCTWMCAKRKAAGRGERRWRPSLPPSSAAL